MLLLANRAFYREIRGPAPLLAYPLVPGKGSIRGFIRISLRVCRHRDTEFFVHECGPFGKIFEKSSTRSGFFLKIFFLKVFSRKNPDVPEIFLSGNPARKNIPEKITKKTQAKKTREK
jgi:hypothetical protein